MLLCFPTLCRVTCYQAAHCVELDAKTRELASLTSQLQQCKCQADKAQQINEDLRAKLMDKELEVQSLEVSILACLCCP